MVERPIADLWANADAAIAGCLGRAGVDAARIAAVGLAGHGNGLYLLDRDGQPLAGIQSLDTRAARLAADLDRRPGRTCTPSASSAPGPRRRPCCSPGSRRTGPRSTPAPARWPSRRTSCAGT
jgi:L-xylulokinase